MLTGAQRVTSFHSSKYDERLMASLRKGRAPRVVEKPQERTAEPVWGPGSCFTHELHGGCEALRTASLQRRALQGHMAGPCCCSPPCVDDGEMELEGGGVSRLGHVVPEAKRHLRTCRGEERAEPENLLGGSDIRTSICTWLSQGLTRCVGL